MSLKKVSRPVPPGARGFSLVLSLTVMAMLLLICIGASALLSVELRSSRASGAYAKARLNAIASARIALGRLQQLAGPDRRVSAPATLLDSDPATPLKADGVALPRYAGIWRGGVIASAYKSSHDAAFMGWLASGTEVDANGSGLTAAQMLPLPKTDIGSALKVRLLSPPKTAEEEAAGLKDGDSREVFVATENFPGGSTATGSLGKFGWWASDEGVKAGVATRVDSTKTSVADNIARAQNVPGFNLVDSADGLKNYPLRTKLSPALIGRSGLVQEPSQWLAEERQFYHEITPYSRSLFTDVASGGLKYDLSLFWAQESGQFDAGIMKKRIGETLTMPGYLYSKFKWIPASPATSVIAAVPASFTQQEWPQWFDLWEYGRLHTIRSIWSDDGNSLKSTSGAEYRNTSAATTIAGIDKSAAGAYRDPVIIAMQYQLGLSGKPGTETGKTKVYLNCKSYMVLWNPYNVPLRFTGAKADSFLWRFVNPPGKFGLTLKDGTTTLLSLSGLNWAFDVGAGYQMVNLRIPFTNASEILAPGETRVYSTPGSTFSDVKNAKPVELAAGLRSASGFEIALYAADNTTPLQVADSNTVTISWTNAGARAEPYGYDMWATLGKSDSDAARATVDDGRGMRNSTGTYSQGKHGEKSTYCDSRFNVTKTVAQIKTTNGSDFGRFTIRLKPEATQTNKGRVLGYGDFTRFRYELRALSPDPANGVAGSEEGTYEKLFHPYEALFTGFTSGMGLDPLNPLFNATPSQTGIYAFTGYTVGDGQPSMIASYIPVAPVGNLAELRHARLGGGARYYREYDKAASNYIPRGYSVVNDAFANSYIHPAVNADSLVSTKLVGKLNNPEIGSTSETPYDHSWIMNQSLWDGFFVSTLEPPVASFYKPLALAHTDAKVAFTGLINGTSKLKNERILANVDGLGGATATLKKLDDWFASGSAANTTAMYVAAAALEYDGGFNINSTSVRAWRSLLNAYNTATLIKNAPAAALGTNTVTTPMPALSQPAALRYPVQTGELATAGSPEAALRLMGGRKMSDAEIDSLAQAIVTEVKKRGPFLSMGEFVNRRLETGELGQSGALQFAIDSVSSLNAFTSAADQISVPGNMPLSPDGAKVYTGKRAAMGMPGYVTQADLLMPIASGLTARSDTFTLRCMGESEEGARAYVELVVQRSPGYVDSGNSPYDFAWAANEVPADSKNTGKVLSAANKAFGRRFVIRATRWLAEEEV